MGAILLIVIVVGLIIFNLHMASPSIKVNPEIDKYMNLKDGAEKAAKTLGASIISELDGIITSAKYKNSEEVNFALKVLGFIEDDKNGAEAVLVKHAKGSRDSSLRSRAVTEMSHLMASDVVRHFEEILENEEDKQVILNICNKTKCVVGELKGNENSRLNKLCVTKLMKIIESHEFNRCLQGEQTEIVKPLPNLGRDGMMALTTLFQQKDSPERRHAAAWAFAYQPYIEEGTVEVPALLQAINDRDEFYRFASVVALGKNRAKDKKIVDALKEHLEDESEKVRDAVEAALKKKGEIKKSAKIKSDYNVNLERSTPEDMTLTEKLFVTLKKWPEDTVAVNMSCVDKVGIAILEEEPEGDGKYFCWNYISEKRVQSLQECEFQEKGFSRLPGGSALVVTRKEAWKQYVDQNG